MIFRVRTFKNYLFSALFLDLFNFFIKNTINVSFFIKKGHHLSYLEIPKLQRKLPNRVAGPE